MVKVKGSKDQVTW